MATANICDLCLMDDDEKVFAIGWYIAEDGRSYDVCQKHAKIVEDAGLEVCFY